MRNTDQVTRSAPIDREKFYPLTHNRPTLRGEKKYRPIRNEPDPRLLGEVMLRILTESA